MNHPFLKPDDWNQTAEENQLVREQVRAVAVNAGTPELVAHIAPRARDMRGREAERDGLQQQLKLVFGSTRGIGVGNSKQGGAFPVTFTDGMDQVFKGLLEQAEKHERT